MKNKVIVIIIFTALTLLTIFVGNKTFLSNFYNVRNSEGDIVKIPVPWFSYYINSDNENTFKTLRSTSNIREYINKYLDTLEACYDESYFYDKDLDITIFKYEVKGGKFLNNIYLDYQLGNYCENEYVLDEDWISEFQKGAKISEIKLEMCENTCTEKDVEKKYIDNLLNYIKTQERIEHNDNVNMNAKYIIKVYYELNKDLYFLSIFKYESYLAFKVVDQDDHPKNAIYKFNNEIKELLENIYK